jgi:chromosome segregation ATPase
MLDDDNLDRRVRKLAVEHAETRWLTLRLDDEVKELRDELRAVRATQQEHGARFDSIDSQLQEHGARFDSIGAQLRSLTQLVGQVLERLPDGEEPRS